MIWHRSHCLREINDQQQEGGLLICGDALQTDLSPFVGQAQMIYLDPPGTTGNSFESLSDDIKHCKYAFKRILQIL